MLYSQFTKRVNKAISGQEIVESIHFRDSVIQKTVDGKILIDNSLTQHKTLEEARKYIKQCYISHKLEEDVAKEIYEDLSDLRIAKIIKEHHNVKVTDTLIETYVELASSNLFTVDPVVFEIRKLNRIDQLIEGKIHYTLADGSVIAISESTQERLNKLLSTKQEIVEQMRQSREFFMETLDQLED